MVYVFTSRHGRNFKPELLARVHEDFLNASLDHCNNTPRPAIVPCTSHHQERGSPFSMSMSPFCAYEWDCHLRRASSCCACSQTLEVDYGEGDSDRGGKQSPGKRESNGSSSNESSCGHHASFMRAQPKANRARKEGRQTLTTSGDHRT